MIDESDGAHYGLDHVVSFETLATGPVGVRISAIDIVESVTVTGEVDATTWETIRRGGCFHLDGQESPAGFEADQPVQLTLRLRAPVADRYRDPDEMLRELLSEPDSPLRHSEAWLATEVMQEVAVPGVPDASAQVGIRTVWADPLLTD